METALPRYYRIVLVADPRWGEGSLSWRVKEVLERQGHTVFFFSPKTHAFAFERKRIAGCGELGTDADETAGAAVDVWALRSASLARFCSIQSPDMMLFADGVVADVEELRHLAGHAVFGCLCEGESQVRAQVCALAELGKNLDFAWVAGDRAWGAACGCEVLGLVQRLEFLADRGFADTPLANTIAYAPGVLCVQNATGNRVGALRELMEKPDMRGLPVRCFGAGWPGEWSCGVRFSEFVYAAKSSRVVVVFADGEARGTDDAAWDAPVALACSAGAELMRWNGGSFETDSPCGSPHVSHGAHCASQRFMDDDIRDLVAKLSEAFAGSGKMPGMSSPRTIVCILGYFGMGNFGDEYILATLDRRLRANVEGLSVVAVSENPQHTLEHRGIYAITLRQQRAVDVTLAHASAALVVAGLLFDQGIRWTMGKAELFSSLRYSTIPGIAGYVTLANMNNAKPVMYGIGAGPLDVTDSRKLVELMGKLGAVFLARDEGTARLIRSCGVPADQAIRKADTAFLGLKARTDLVDGWMRDAFGNVSPDEAGVRLMAVSLRDYENLPPDFSVRVACALDAVAERHPDAHFAFCVLDPDDLRLAQLIIGRMTHAAQAHLFESGDAIESVCDLLSRCHGGFSMRYHCSLILNSFGKPCVGVAYLPKVASLYVEMGCEDLLLDTQAASGDIEAKLEMLMGDYDRWTQVVDRGSHDLRLLSQEAEEALLGWVRERSRGKSFEIPKEFYLNDLPECEILGDGARREVDKLRVRVDELRVRADELEQEGTRLRAELDDVRASHSFKAGLALTALPRALRRLLQRE